MSRYWYGNTGGFSAITAVDHADRAVPRVDDDTANCDGPVRRYRMGVCGV